MFSMLAGWGNAALPDRNFGFLTIYCLGPITGACFASLLFTRIVEPLMKKKKESGNMCICNEGNN